MSMDAALRARLKAHTDAMGSDVSTYVTAAVLRQIDDDSTATEVMPSARGDE
ncbi:MULTISPECIES: hypothetical protein [unclassified Streptomyces]|uniref:hypothetical protein n=1 Tax=unclassified Streptomyces TaxID=2593676 RepID=UPI0013A6DE53|nr:MULTISPECIES: hypothetical protein [unclassified Streptomyces]